MQRNIIELIAKEQSGQLTEDERIYLQEWINQSEDNRLWHERWMNNSDEYLLSFQKGTESKDRARARVWSMIGGSSQGNIDRKRIWPIAFYSRLAAAAVVLLVVAALWMHFSDRKINQDNNAIVKIDARPGADKAILTLADGHTIILDSVGNGLLASQPGATVTKTTSSQISYKGIEKENQEAVWNTISTPIGGQFSLILADGSKVWLNAGSSLRFPTIFNGDSRIVVLTGEGYFEIAPNKSKPFKVQLGTFNLDVLGTHFDVNGYADEMGIKTTLLQGSVKINSNSSSKIIAPGQQANIVADGSIDVKDVPNAESNVAWVHGDFSFIEQDLPSIMHQISRWYDVDVEFRGTQTNKTFTGIIGRKKNVSDVLKMLGDSKIVTFEIEEEQGGRKKIIVQNH